jgi:hypothetical protein
MYRSAPDGGSDVFSSELCLDYHETEAMSREFRAEIDDTLIMIPRHLSLHYYIMLEYGGGFPWGDPDVMQWECIDKANAVTIELRRVKD